MGSTYTERLALVRAAIDEILLTGQSVEFDGKSFTAVNMEHLIKLEERYEKLATAEARGPGASRSFAKHSRG